MVRKLFIIALLVVVCQATISAQAAMHFPGTASVHNSTFSGSGQVEGFGNTVQFSKVSLHLTGNLQPVCVSGDSEEDDPLPQNIDFSEDAPSLTHNGKSSFKFADVDLKSLVANCYEESYTKVAVKGTLNVLYTANEFKNPSTLFAQAFLPFTCNIDDSGNGNCVQGQESANVVH